MIHFRTGATRPAVNLADWLRIAALDRSSHAAIVEPGRSTSYAELGARAGAIAEWLSGNGVEPGDRVAVLLPRGSDAAAALFAVPAIGAIVVPISDRLRARQIEYVLEHSGARILLTEGEILTRLNRRLTSNARVVEVGNLPARGTLTPIDSRPSDPSHIIYTSGSTGLPKGVVHTHGSLGAGVDAVIGYLGLRPDDRIASLLPFSSVYGLNQLLCAVRCGCSLVVDRSPTPNDIVAALGREKVTVVAAVPALWTQLATATSFSSATVPSARIIQNAGGHLPVPIVRQLRRAHPGAELFLMYGQTETFRGSYLPPGLVDDRPNSIGKAMPGTEIHLVREDLSLCEPGEVGELVQCGPSLALGYWRDPEATARTFRRAEELSFGPRGQRLAFTGDLARMDEDGLLYFVSRKDHLIKTLGHRVGPDEVLDALLASGEISEGIVTSEADEVRGERIVAVVVLAPGGSLQALKRFARAELPPHMMPARYLVGDSLPRMSGGKYDMAAVRRWVSEGLTPLAADARR